MAGSVEDSRPPSGRRSAISSGTRRVDAPERGGQETSYREIEKSERASYCRLRSILLMSFRV